MSQFTLNLNRYTYTLEKYPHSISGHVLLVLFSWKWEWNWSFFLIGHNNSMERRTDIIWHHWHIYSLLALFEISSSFVHPLIFLAASLQWQPLHWLWLLCRKHHIQVVKVKKISTMQMMIHLPALSIHRLDGKFKNSSNFISYLTHTYTSYLYNK